MKILKILGIGFLSLVIMIVIGTILVTNLLSAFGEAPNAEFQAGYQSSNNFTDEEFVNEIPTSMDMSVSALKTVLWDYIVGIPDHEPAKLLKIQKPVAERVFEIPDTLTQLMWFGHSAFLLQTNGKTILLDPMLGTSPSPIPAFGSQRFTEGLPISLEDLPVIDVIVFSHDHYDHLDYPTLRELKDRVQHLVVPLGVESHLQSWGFREDQITALDWWEDITLDGITFTSTPARHFSGRGLTDRNRTLWSSWVIKSPQANIYFSGDGGYGPHFKAIGERYGPFDFALMECGQYDERWRQIHMMPEETVQASIDVKAKVFAPIHWGAFVLALHSWYDPVDRAVLEAQRLKISIAVPAIGELIIVPTSSDSNKSWWKAFK